MMKILISIVMINVMLKFNNMVMFYVGLLGLISLVLLLTYSLSNGDYFLMISSYFSYDVYSFYMILLSVWVISLMSLSLFNEMSSDLVNKMWVFNLMLMVLVMFFGSFNFLIMYLFFEVSLIPTFMIVLYWGNNWERLEASFYLLMYMMFISLPLLAYIMMLYFLNNSLDMNLIGLFSLEMINNLGMWDFLILFGAFFIKLPVYLFHVWLPKAHVEAPVYGSMLLAAILLKLGGYGLIRLVMMFIYSSMEWSSWVVSLGFIGALYVSVYCLIQVDMKMLVAYSSVVHMNFMMASLFSLLKVGVISTVIVMISHGLCSSGLFFMVNMFYCRSNSRLMILNKGYINCMPAMIMWWFLLCSSNFSFPFSLNFLGEVMMIMVMLGWSMTLIFLIMMICFFSGAYSLYLFSVVSHGGLYSMNNCGVDEGGLSEHLNLYLHYVPLLLLMLNLYVFMN